MHERAASRDIVRKALEVVPAGSRITVLRISLGADAHDAPEAVSAWIEAAAAGTPADGASVLIVPASPGAVGMRLVSLEAEER